MNRKLFWVGLGTGLVVSVIFFSVLTPKTQTFQYRVKSRLDTQMKFLPLVAKRPIFGYGLGCFKYIGPTIVNNSYGVMTDGWSDYLERTMECGIILPVLFLCLCWDTLKRFKPTPLFFSICGIPFVMLFHSLLNSVCMGVLFITLFSLWETECVNSF